MLNKKSESRIISAEYKGSFGALALLPKPPVPEIVFAGRSNVGKSSLINFLCNKKEIAHTSSQPGKTQTFNYYAINNTYYLVDLPGYGFAKISLSMRQKWEHQMKDYFLQRRQLATICQLVDSRIKPQKNDLNFAENVISNNLPLAVIFTKADRKLKNETKHNISAYQDELLKINKHLPTIFITSSSDRTGNDELVEWMFHILETHKSNL
jgi:GTP-binding protein